MSLAVAHSARLRAAVSGTVAVLAVALVACGGDSGGDADRVVWSTPPSDVPTAGNARTGSEPAPEPRDGSEARARNPGLLQVMLRPVDGSDARGVATIRNGEDGLELAIEASVAPTRRGQAYEVWLYDDPPDLRSLGAQVTDAEGQYRGTTELPDDYERYRFIDVSLEEVDGSTDHGGRSVLRGAL